VVITGICIDSEPSSKLGLVELQVTDGNVYLRPDDGWGTDPIFFPPDGGTLSNWTHDTNSVIWVYDTIYTITTRVQDIAGNTSTSTISATYRPADQAYTDLSLELSSQTILQNDTIDVSGKLTRLPDTGVDLSGLTVNLTITAPDNSFRVESTTTYDSFGHYEISGLSGFNLKGTYTIQAAFDGSAALYESESDVKSVLVGTSTGYAIIIQGKIPNEEGLGSHNKSVNRIYDTLKRRGFVDPNIYYFNFDTNQAGVDEIPSKSAIQSAIENWAPARMNGSPAPLIIVMVDHGFRDAFYIGDETITPSELNSWLATLEGKLNPTAIAEKRIVIIGACYSGSFIPANSKQGRVMITSSAEDEESYKGPLEPDGIRSGEFFMEELFKQLWRGETFKGAFEKAAAQTETFTRKGGGTTNAKSPPYFDNAMQHPLLDDNGDGIGNNVLSEGQGDGQVAQSLYLGVGLSYDTNSEDNPAELLEVTETLYLDINTSSTQMWAVANDDSQASSVWMEVRPPSKSLSSQGGTEQLEIDLNKVFMTFNESASRWERTYDLFDESGMHEVFYFVRDVQTSEISPMKRSVVYKARAGNRPPSAFGLISPADGAETKTVLILDWGDSADPDGDNLTYNLIIAADRNFNNIIHQSEEIPISIALVDKTAGLEDLKAYYWKVEAMDSFGAKSESTQAWSFTTNNTNVFPGFIAGTVYDGRGYTPIDGATVSVAMKNSGISATTFDGGNFMMIVPAGTFGVFCTYGRHPSVSMPGVKVREGDVTNLNIVLLPGATTKAMPWIPLLLLEK
jgi:hypothetical protein